MKQTLNYREQTDGYQREGGLGGERVKQVMGIKEGSCPDEHQVIYGIVESLHSIPETHVTLYVNQLELKQELKKKKKEQESIRICLMYVWGMRAHVGCGCFAFVISDRMGALGKQH